MPWSLTSALSKLCSLSGGKKRTDAQRELRPPFGEPHASQPSPLGSHTAAAPAPKPQKGWRIPEKYKLGEVLGTGAYGSVHGAEDTENDRYVAIKRIKYLFDDPVDCKRILREIAIMSRLNNEHIVRIYEVPIPPDWRTFNETYIIMEACDTDLKKILKKDVHLSSAHIETIFYRILLGLKYIHSANIYHRDLKPANCLVNKDCSVKICDFGLSRALGTQPATEMRRVPSIGGLTRSKKRCLTSHVVTRWYRAPELILCQDNYTEAIDTWSAGCILAELLGMLGGTTREDRGPLFKGSSCVLLSPKTGDDDTDRPFQADKITNDQLAMIVKILGTPDLEEIGTLQHANAKGYIKCFPMCEGTGLRGGRFAHVDDACMDLMEGLLRFGATKRMCVDQALAHEVFVREVDGMVIRDPSQERVADEVVDLAFEKEPMLNDDLLRRYFKQELKQISSTTHA